MNKGTLPSVKKCIFLKIRCEKIETFLQKLSVLEKKNKYTKQKRITK